MRKIATPTELDTELTSLVQMNRQGSTRERLETSLRRLADRLASDQTKVAKTYNLENIARDLVGDGKTPNLFFVTDKAGLVRAILRTTKSEAIRVAGVVTGAYLLEDRKNGEVWSSPEAEKAREAGE